MITKTLARTTRTTRTTFAVIGAPTMSFSLREGRPFEVEVTWTNGNQDYNITVRGWVMRRDGTPRRVVSTRMDLLTAPPWLFALIHETPEPGFESAPDPGVDEEPAEADTEVEELAAETAE